MVQEPATEEITIYSHSVERVPFLKSVATQSDWSSRLSRESWYGHHRVWPRILFLTLMISSLTAMATLFVAMQFPIFQPMSTEQLDEWSFKIDRCFFSVCQAVKELDLACIVNSDGQSARLDFDSYKGSPVIPLTSNCTHVLEKAFRTVDLDSLPGLIDLRTKAEKGSELEGILQIDPEKCAMGGDWEFVPLVDFKIHGPGDRVEKVLEPWTCPEAMSEEVQKEVLPNLQKAKDWILAHRHAIVGAGAFIISIAVQLGTIFMWMPLLLVTTLLLRLNLSWPKDFCGMKQITFWSTWRMLLLLSFLTDQNSNPAMPVLLMFAALYYKNWQAALEWLFLTILMFGASDLDPFLDSCMQKLVVFDGLGIIQYFGSWVAFFIPGQGWWKLVSIYVFCRSYPRAKTASPNGSFVDQAPQHLQN